MNLEDLKKLDSEIGSHKRKASRFRDDAKDVARMRETPFRVRIAHPDSYRSNYTGIDSGRAESRSAKDDALHRVWEELGGRVMRLVETDLLEQARKEQMTADLLQARLDRMLAAAGSLIGEEPQESSSDD